MWGLDFTLKFWLPTSTSSNNMTAPVVLCTFRHYFYSPMLITTRRSQSVFSRPDSKSQKQPKASCGVEYVKADFNSCSPTEVGLDCTLQVPMEQMELKGFWVTTLPPTPPESLEREWLNDNERCIFSAHCVLLYTQSALNHVGGYQHLLGWWDCHRTRRQCAYHTPATGGEERESLCQSSDGDY